MSNIFTRNFNGREICTLMWNGKLCWIGVHIVEALEYEKPSKTLNQCIEAEEFDIGIEYDVLTGDNLNKFKKDTTVAVVTSIKYASRLTILYEDGLYGFLQYTDMPIGIEFRKWLRREVVPSLRAEGFYNIETEIPKDKFENTIGISLEEVKNTLSVSDFKNDFNEERKIKFSSSFRYKHSSDFDYSKFERFKIVSKDAEMFKKLLDKSKIESLEQLMFLKTLYEESGINLPFLNLEDLRER
ncbi:BRO family protein [uncultured Clostridium sp.]|uniref:BRO family protein n=1 Tax=uncultured Clostridium sp. TaxID=59620 RepID=UPI002607752A|nr:BRO family protein [uncultured Clostridium sp.]